MICKKVTRTVIPLMLSMVFLFSSFSSANAASYLTYTSHGYAGNLSWVTETIPNSSTGNPSSGTGTLTGTLFLTDMTINWGSPQSGTFTIKLSGYNSGNVFLCENCRLTNYGVSDNGAGSATFSVSGQDYVRIYYYHSNVAQTPTGFSGDWNRVAVSEIDAIKQVYTYMTNYMYDSTNGYSYLGHIDGTLNTLTGYVNNIQNTMSNVYNSVDDLESILNSILSLQTYNVPEYKYLAYYQFSRFSQLDTEFHRGGGGYIYDMGPFVKVNSVPTTYIGEYSLACNYANRDLYIIYYSFYWNPAFNLIDSNGNSVTWTDSYKVNSNDGYMLYYQHYHYSENNRINLNIVPVAGVNGGYLLPVFIGYHIPSEVADMYNFEIDNTYTRLLHGIINAVGTISQTQINENNTNINNYNNYQTQINNVENNYYNQFNSHETNIENNNTFNFDGLSSDGVNVYHNLFTNAFNISFVKWPIMIILLGLVIVIILG